VILFLNIVCMTVTIAHSITSLPQEEDFHDLTPGAEIPLYALESARDEDEARMAWGSQGGSQTAADFPLYG
jgi:hypothetical protein